MTTVSIASSSSASAGTAALTPGRRPEFASACVRARDGLQDVVNLALVTDSLRQREDPDPRTTTNRLIAFLSVRAWEVFVRDVGRICGHPAVGAAGDRVGCLRSGPAGDVLAAASGGRLPAQWRIAFPLTGSGTALTFAPRERAGTDEDVAAAVDWWVSARHGLVHRRHARDVAWPVPTDAYDSDGRDVGPTTARFAMTLFLQLVDQSIRVVAEGSGMARPHDLLLPEHWLDGRVRAEPDAPRLWTGQSLRGSTLSGR